MKKLTQDDRSDINRRLRAGDRQKDIADDFGVSQSTINRVRSQAKKAERDMIDDPKPSIETPTLQKQFWSKQERLTGKIKERKDFLNSNRDYIKNQIHSCKRSAYEAATSKIAASYLQRAETYRQELAALDDFSEIDSEITDLCKDLYQLSQVLCKLRKAGLGRVG